MYIRQLPEVYDLCHTFLHVARVKKPTAMRDRVLFSHGLRFFDSHNVQKRATKSDTLGHCLMYIVKICGLHVLKSVQFLEFLRCNIFKHDTLNIELKICKYISSPPGLY